MTSERQKLSRRRFVEATSAATIFGLAGCTGDGSSDGGDGGGDGGDGGGDGGNGTSTSGGSTTTVTHWSGFFDNPNAGEWRDWYVQEASDQYNVEVETSAFSYADMRQKYLTGAKTGTPDIIEGVLSHVNEYAVAGLIEPIGDWAESLDYYDDFLQGGINSVTWNDQLWALPMKGNGRTFFYRTDVFEEMGWEDGPAEGAEEFLEQMSTITNSKDGMHGYHNTTKKGQVRAFQEWISHVYKHEDSVFELNNGEWSVTPSAETFGEIFEWFYAKPYLETDAANPDARNGDWRANDIGYLQGNYACVPCGPWLLGMQEEAQDPETAGNNIEQTATATISHTPNASDPKGTYLETEANMINANSENPEAAREALGIHASPESVKMIGEKDPSYLQPPPFGSVESSIEREDRMEIKTAFENGKGLAFISWGQPRTALYESIQQVIYDEKDPYTAGEDLHAEFQDIASNLEA